MAKKSPKIKTGKLKKVHKIMKEFKKGELSSGSSKGPKVKSRKQALAIAMSSADLSKKNKKRK